MAVLELLSTIGPLSVMLMLMILGELSRRLGAVLKTGKTYRYFYVAAFLLAWSVGVRLLNLNRPAADFDMQNKVQAFSLWYSVPLTAGVLLGALVAWRYWGWLVYAHDGASFLGKKQ